MSPVTATFNFKTASPITTPRSNDGCLRVARKDNNNASMLSVNIYTCVLCFSCDEAAVMVPTRSATTTMYTNIIIIITYYCTDTPHAAALFSPPGSGGKCSDFVATEPISHPQPTTRLYHEQKKAFETLYYGTVTVSAAHILPWWRGLLPKG